MKQELSQMFAQWMLSFAFTMFDNNAFDDLSKDCLFFIIWRAFFIFGLKHAYLDLRVEGLVGDMCLGQEGEESI